MKKINIPQIKTTDELLVEHRLKKSRSAEYIARKEDLPIEKVRAIQIAYWEDYAKNL